MSYLNDVLVDYMDGVLPQFSGSLTKDLKKFGMKAIAS
ncbi:hypothetical protein SAMN05421790_10562 [Kroppenstedtia eburnea]|uniref:Uncharacterized protein n=1 Tax=Kroppenstedtia eburnea TaxID=714067 RepID=A0A1N7LY43_9BACL|nr:hypothetical protein SAMN05421790_10562 [Kroppenstedtia eburnea]